MGVGTIITVLSKIPWGQVVETAPKVADAAAKLWNRVANRRKRDSRQSEQRAASPDAPPSDPELLEARVLALEDGVIFLQEQMQASSELIKALADQNAQLVKRVELIRTRLVRSVIATIFCGTLLLAVVIYHLFRN
jgi:hypothetical protein